jgi:indolepyruvate ferredoxin oxidoreductase
MTKSVTTLDDKYVQQSGRVFINSNQALVRLPLDQARRDRALGLKTAGYISGYRGSPLGVYDAALWAAQDKLDEYDIRFQAGLNEDLAVTAIRGTQELSWFGTSQYQGVFGLWYGKGVGVDRACEALKMGNFEGTSAHGGFLALAGDDHGGKSSSTAHQSEHTLIAGFLPILYPSTIAEILAFGLYGWALSRYSGLYVALKCITDTLDLSASVELPDHLRAFATPDHPLPPGGLNLQRGRLSLALEEFLVTQRLPAAAAFVRANPIDHVTLDSDRRELGIVAAGKAYLDVRQALADLGLSPERCDELGIRIYKPGMIWPLEPEGLSSFASDSRALLVVEEKRPVIEDQIARLLYSLPTDRRPALAGKSDLKGAPLLSQTGELSPTLVRKALITVLGQLGLADEAVADHARDYARYEGHSAGLGGTRYRPAFFCSGCPHNTSTRVPDGSIAISAVGCHGLAGMVMPERNTLPPMMPMGGDGMPWVGVSTFTDRPHIFQNLGDGTYSHSGILSIRAAVAAEANMTFKLLFNDAVAMTGGQPVESHASPIDMINQLVAERVDPVLLVSDDPGKYSGAKLPPGVTVHHRDELDRLQRELRDKKGVSALVYEQTCATEKRRRRKRGTYPDPDKRVFINQDVCEGCGDCSVQSNCVSIQPLETEFGRKRRIDQSTCNKDYSCLKGFCPSFVTVTGAKTGTRPAIDPSSLDAAIAALPVPSSAAIGDHGYNMLVAGIGGTGVLTVGALLGMAAHLEGKGVTILDLTGMAQKGGAVSSHIRFDRTPADIHSSRLDVAMSDLILGCDMIVASGKDVMKTIRPGETIAIANADVSPTGEFQTNRNLDLGESELAEVIREGLAGGPFFSLHATKLATDLTGDSIATNLLMVGYAAQKGLLPVSIASIEEAIRLNGAFVNGNLRTLALGRLAAHDPEAIAAQLAPRSETVSIDTLDDLLASRTRLLTDYQDGAYAQDYLSFVRGIEARVGATGLKGGDLFVREVALTLSRLMAYKDEYEVARLHSDPKFWERLRQQFSGDFKVTFHLAPPILPGRDASGRPRKREFGSWMMPLFRLLARLKGLRGTMFDPFGYTKERRWERELITDYRALIESIVDRLTTANLGTAIDLAGAASDVRGFGPVKEASLAEYRARCAELLRTLDAAKAPSPAEGRAPSDTQAEVCA